MGTFPTHNNERERKVEGILGFLYPCPHKAKFLLFSTTHNRCNKFRITKLPKYMSVFEIHDHQTSNPCLLQIQTPNVLFNCFRQLSYYKKPCFHNFSECIYHFKSALLAFLQYQKRKGQRFLMMVLYFWLLVVESLDFS